MSIKLDKNAKELAQDLLKLQGVDYTDRLNKKHQEVISNKSKIIRKCEKNKIKNKKKKNKKIEKINKKNENIEEINQESNENLESFEDENYNEDDIEEN